MDQNALLEKCVEQKRPLMKTAEIWTTWDLQILHQKTRAYRGQPTSVESRLKLQITWPPCQSATNEGLILCCYGLRLTGRFSWAGKRVGSCSLIRSWVERDLFQVEHSMVMTFQMERSIVDCVERLINTVFLLGFFSHNIVGRRQWTQVLQVIEHVIIVRQAWRLEQPVAGRPNKVRCSRTKNDFWNDWSDTRIERIISGSNDWSDIFLLCDIKEITWR